MQQLVLKSKAMQLTEHRLGEPIELFLQRRYVIEGATLQVIADELGIRVSTASRWLSQVGIVARSTGSRRRPEAAA